MQGLGLGGCEGEFSHCFKCSKNPCCSNSVLLQQPVTVNHLPAASTVRGEGSESPGHVSPLEGVFFYSSEQTTRAGIAPVARNPTTKTATLFCCHFRAADFGDFLRFIGLVFLAETSAKSKRTSLRIYSSNLGAIGGPEGGVPGTFRKPSFQPKVEDDWNNFIPVIPVYSRFIPDLFQLGIRYVFGF